MLLNIVKSGEQDQERCEEWLVNKNPGFLFTNHSYKGTFFNHLVSQSVELCVTFKFTKSWKKRQRMFVRMMCEYGP